VEVAVIALKDIILPGEMREIMNQVVLLEDNPILVRLKELETLEKLVEKVDRVTVNGGFEGLLDNLLETRKPVSLK
jgi:hypothetical protein